MMNGGNMSELKISTEHNMVVQTDPTIGFSNGMVLWLGEKGETVTLTDYDMELIYRADGLISQIGMYRYSSRTKTEKAKPTPSIEKKPWWRFWR
jgi:hypothetical protein